MTPEEVVKKMNDELAEAKSKAQELEGKLHALEAKADASAAELKAAQDKAEKSTADVVKLQAGIDEITKKMHSIDKEDKKEKSLSDAIADVLKSEEFKKHLKSGSFKSQAGKTYEVKTSTANVTAPVTMTQMIPGVSFPRDRALAFIPNLMTGTVGADKNRIGYIKGTYTSNVGYVDEGAANATEDAVTAVEVYRSLAKASAKMKVTAEMFEDANFIASRIENRMMTKGLSWLDSQIFKGDGNDSTAPKHVYGLKTVATAFDAAKAGVSAAVDSPNIGDLADAMKLQGAVIDAASSTTNGGYNLDVIFMNPVDAYKYRHTKATNGNYIINRLADGTDVMSGMRVVETTAVASGELFAMESAVAEWYWKRQPELKIGQEGTDLSTDQYTIVLFLRGQVLVEEADLKGLIYVSNIETALAALAKATE